MDQVNPPWLGGGLVQFSGGVSSFLFLYCFFQEVVPVSVFLFFCDYLTKYLTTMIIINDKLTKSRNPVEHGFKLEGHQGQIIQSLDDGYNLIKFEQFKIRKQVTINRRTQWILVPLEWYVHAEDLKK